MKKLVLAAVMAMASLSLVYAPTLRAQDSTITIKDPIEFNTYQNCSTQTDAKTKATCLESFLTAYPQSVVKNSVLDSLIDTYQGLNDPANTLSAATRLLQVDPSNMKAIFISVLIKNRQCTKTPDAQTCDDAAALAQRGLAGTKPAATADADWKKMVGGTYPVFHSAIALDDIASKKDINGGILEYRTELMLYSPEQTKVWWSQGLWDTLQLAEAYTKQEVLDAKVVLQTAATARATADALSKAKAGADPVALAKATDDDTKAEKDAKDAKDADANDFVQAVWFYARAWNYATPVPIKTQIEAKMKFYYSKYHGNLDGLDAVKTQAADTLFPPGNYTISPAPTPAELAHKGMVGTPDKSVMNLSDAEYVLANGDKADVDELWAALKGKATTVPGEILSATASAIQLAVSQDAKDANPKYADFIVNLKTPLTSKEIPAVGLIFGDRTKGQAELDGTYDSYTQVPGTDTTAASAQIVLRDGVVIPEKKKPVPTRKPSPAHKPSAAH
jgi:hypothetical protein